MSEPITSLKCPSCGALVPLFERKPNVTCGVCGAEFPVTYVEPPRAVKAVELQGEDVVSTMLAGFVLWLLSRDRK